MNDDVESIYLSTTFSAKPLVGVPTNSSLILNSEAQSEGESHSPYAARSVASSFGRHGATASMLAIRGGRPRKRDERWGHRHNDWFHGRSGEGTLLFGHSLVCLRVFCEYIPLNMAFYQDTLIVIRQAKATCG